LEADKKKQAGREFDFKHAEALKLMAAASLQKLERKRKYYHRAKSLARELSGPGESAVEQLKMSQPRRQQFEPLYTADLIGVEDSDAETAMVWLRKYFESRIRTGKKPAGGGFRTHLQQAAIARSVACEKDTESLTNTVDALNAQIVALSAPPK